MNKHNGIEFLFTSLKQKLIAYSNYILLIKALLYSPSKRQPELVDDASVGKVLGLVELSHLHANVGPHVEVHVVAAVKDVVSLSFHAEKASSGLNILKPVINGDM